MAILAGLFLILLQANPAPIGMILQSEGEVFVQRGTARNPAKLADLLYPGDQVVTTTGQATFVLCPSSERASIKNGSRVELTASAITSRAGTPPVKAAARCALPKVALGAENLERIGGMRPRGYPPISVFTGGPVTNPHPTFEWAPANGAASYQITLTDESGVTVWQFKAANSPAEYPASLPALKEGMNYQWDLRADADGKIVGQQAAMFEVKPNAELARPSVDDVASKLGEAAELENAGYYAEAASRYRAVQKVNPNDERITRRLIWLYWNSGLIAAASELIDKSNIR